MPPKKKQQKASAYGLFCEEHRDQWEIQIGKRPTMEELIQLCSSDWDRLDDNTKAQYKQQAKERNGTKIQGASPPKRCARDGDMRLDALRLPISQRRDINQMEQEELAMLDGMLPDSGLIDLQIVVLDVECFQKCDVQDFSIHRDFSKVSAVPAEVSIGIYTMRSGIILRDTILVIPDSIPLGMGLQYRESVDRHRVPFEFSAADSLLPVKRTKDYLYILNRLNEQLMIASCPPGIPVFATACSRLDVIGCLNWLRRSATRATGDSSHADFLREGFLTKVFSLEMLVDTFLTRQGAQGSISHAEMGKIITDTQVDYLPTVRCAFHELEQTDSTNCAHLRVSKALFGLTTMFEPFFQFGKTEKHLPPHIEVYAAPTWPSGTCWPQSEASTAAERPQRATNRGNNGSSNFYYADDDEEAGSGSGPAGGPMSIVASSSYNPVENTTVNRMGSSCDFGVASSERAATNSIGTSNPQRPPSAMSAISSSTYRSINARFSALTAYDKAKQSRSSSASVSGASTAYDDADDADAESIAARRSRRDQGDEFFDDDARSNASSQRVQSGKRVLPVEGAESDSEADTVTDCDDLLQRETTPFDNQSMTSSMTSWSSAMRTSVSGLTDKYVNNQSFARPQQVDYSRSVAHSVSSTSDRLPSLGRGRGRILPLPTNQ